MTIKNLIVAAATVAVTATTASANNAFPFGPQLDASDTLELQTVTIADAGVLEIYDYSTGSLGALLGTEALNAGANTNVKVNVGFEPSADVLAVLKIDGQVVATKAYDVQD